MIHVVTWNVHGFVDATGRFSPEPVLRKLRTVEADIVALQEVEDRPWQGRHALQWLAERGGWHAWAGPTLRRGDSHYGNAILSRRPALAVRLHDISIRGVEPRGVLEVEFAHAEARLRVMATHLGLKRSERRQQLGRILEIAGAPVAGRTDVLAGDFNEWLPGSGLLRRLRRSFPAGTRGGSFPAHRPMLGLDRIWVRPASAFGGFEILPLARGESDHRPVMAAIR